MPDNQVQFNSQYILYQERNLFFESNSQKGGVVGYFWGLAYFLLYLCK